MSIEIEIPALMPAHGIPTQLMSTAIESVLKSILPEEDFSVTVNFKNHESLIIEWFAVN